MVTDQSINVRNILFTFSYWPRIFKMLWKANPIYFLSIWFFSIGRGMLPALTLLATQQVVNTVVTLESNTSFNVVMLPLFIFIGLLFLNELLLIFQLHTTTVYQTYISNYVNIEIIKKVGRMSLPSFENSLIQDQLQRSQQEASFRPYQIFEQILSIITGIVTLLSSAAILFSWSWKLTLLLGVIPVLFFYAYLSLGKTEFLIHYKRIPNYRKAWYLLQLQIRDSSFKEAKLFKLNNYLLNQYRNIINQFLDEDKYLAKKRTKLSIFSQLMGNIIVGVVIFFIAYAGYKGEISIGSLVAYFSVVSLTFSNSQNIVWDIVNICKNNLYIEQLFSFLDFEDKEDEIELKQLTNSFPSKIQSVEFINVSFKYPNTSNYALKNINLTINKGETLAVVGKNGSGKSTLIKLISRLYPDFEGEILINGESIRNIPINKLYEEIGVVFQDFVNYEMTLANNVGFGDINNHDNKDKISESLEQTGLTMFAENLPNKLDTQLGKYFLDGYQLSGGQWQRLAIARAFMRNASLYILDEPSAALDAEAEADIFKRFAELVEGKIGVFISHRYTSIHFADKIIVLSDGEIAEEGTHDSLIENEGIYSKLYKLQMNNFKVR
ncbi:ABC transporter ATP-binding protein [Metasolibacillus meyeri]|uniref:ABC transporter ATP-binding protein n=1 Tax=Metasolibacillus meyeri TaxID=1071052 RepID=UPI000D30BDF4|nr:ABC transporter ATP-binding protein [Metasolibacillus meyeri]